MLSFAEIEQKRAKNGISSINYAKKVPSPQLIITD